MDENAQKSLILFLSFVHFSGGELNILLTFDICTRTQKTQITDINNPCIQPLYKLIIHQK